MNLVKEVQVGEYEVSILSDDKGILIEIRDESGYSCFAENPTYEELIRAAREAEANEEDDQTPEEH